MTATDPTIEPHDPPAESAVRQEVPTTDYYRLVVETRAGHTEVGVSILTREGTSIAQRLGPDDALADEFTGLWTWLSPDQVEEAIAALIGAHAALNGVEGRFQVHEDNDWVTRSPAELPAELVDLIEENRAHPERRRLRPDNPYSTTHTPE